MEPIPSVFFMQHQTNSKSAEVGEDEQIHLHNLNIFSRYDDAIDFFLQHLAQTFERQLHFQNPWHKH